MVAVKSYQAEAFLKAVERVPAAVLFYGTDAGLVGERAATLARRLAEAHEGEVLRLDDADLDDDPDRLAVELLTPPMFGGRKIVRAATGKRVNASALKPILEIGKLEGFLIVEAGHQRKGDALLTLFETAAGAAAVACYPDEARDLEGVIGEVLGTAKMQIAPEARKLLVGRLGADRALSRAEVEKLVLYARGKARIEEADVEAAVGDAAETALDRVVLAAASGRAGEAVRECERCVTGGESAQSVIAALQRHFLRLHRLRSGHDAGGPLEDLMRALKPQPNFRQKAAIEQQTRAWTLSSLNAALTRIGDAAKAARLNSALEDTLAERLLMGLGALAAEKRPDGRTRGPHG
ncbi:MAG TPA: DNA polymerase III subunit delta [Hyphomicrobiaceae bacterium]|jgi:DNA polymerase-3 subunit delta|nr:DNA polymerase III subunit delta [Hyphomicrobiaceae bacterium]